MTYSRNIDAFYLYLRQRGRSVRMVKVAPGINADFDARGRLLGIEILDASFHVPSATLSEAVLPGPRRRAKLKPAPTLGALLRRGVREMVEIEQGRKRAPRVRAYKRIGGRMVLVSDVRCTLASGKRAATEAAAVTGSSQRPPANRARSVQGASSKLDTATRARKRP